MIRLLIAYFCIALLTLPLEAIDNETAQRILMLQEQRQSNVVTPAESFTNGFMQGYMDAYNNNQQREYEDRQIEREMRLQEQIEERMQQQEEMQQPLYYSLNDFFLSPENRPDVLRQYNFYKVKYNAQMNSNEFTELNETQLKAVFSRYDKYHVVPNDVVIAQKL